MSRHRREGTRGAASARSSPRELVRATLTDPEGVVPAHRVATWTLAAQPFAITQPEELSALVEEAASCIGIRNDQERWVATFGPIADPAEDTGENRHAKFIFGSCDRMI